MIELLSIPLKKPTDVDVIKPLQNVIQSTLSVSSKDIDYFDNITEFSKLRKNALWRAFEKYESSLDIIYRYYDQICSLEGKLPINELQIPFKWKDAFDRTIFGGKLSLTITTLAYEKICVLFNIAALQSCVASSQSFENDDGLKLAAKLFQLAAGIFSYLKSNIMLIIQQEPTPDMSPETLEALSLLMLAQAQEIFTHKAIFDKMKDSVIAKLAAQTEDLYSECSKIFQKEIFRAFWDKDWVPMIMGKEYGYRGLSEYYQSSVCRNVKAIGEEICRLDFATEMFKAAMTKSIRLEFFMDYYNRADRRLTEVKKDNDFIYHERIPDIASLPSINKANVAKLSPIPPQLSSDFQDLFIDLLPIAVHRAMSKFEVQKNELISIEIAKIRNARQLLNGALASMNLPAAIEDINGTEIPQSLIDKAGYIRDAGGIKALENIMNELPELLQRNKDILDETEKMLDDELNSDNHLRSQFKERWTRLPSIRLTEQFRSNIQKYRGIINNAITADKIVRDKFETHRDAVNILSMDSNHLANFIPTGSAIHESNIVRELRQFMLEVDILKTDQDKIEFDLQSETIDLRNEFVSACERGNIPNEEEIKLKYINTHYGPIKKRIDECSQRLDRLLEAIHITHEKFTKEQSSCGSSREQMLCKLAAAYDVFKDLKNNLQEGVKFYNDLTQLLVMFQNKISDFCFARKTEKEELFKDITTHLSQHGHVQASELSYHSGSLLVPSESNPTSYLPYPAKDEGSMPNPYSAVTLAPYPNFLPPPLPATFNPYTTLPYSFPDEIRPLHAHQPSIEPYTSISSFKDGSHRKPS
ncbi:programmed cell death 6-interacting protein isoform X2 [Phymastichus coffea]|uniref:programmed cell death 6-interacting protein isoform X2 n=1 Tax=Phymastichus coffea TaxID=108790 RepID=UPI00273C68AD|nr:programmed cell death 6-interacting protein isoform X2 [Phymastichus coffea]